MHEMWWISMGLKKSKFLATTEDGEQVHPQRHNDIECIIEV
jgi:hypothetical protein